MKLLSLVALLAGLSSAADLRVWEFDDSCDPHREAIQKAYDQTEDMAVKAQEDLLTLLDPRPAYSQGIAKKVRNWHRIARAVTNMFGFVPNKDGMKMDDEYYSNLMYVFHRMTTTLRDGKMVPENGYGGLKPLILCDKARFTWVGANDKDPKDPEKRPLRVSRAKDIVPGHVGAWTYKDRYIGVQAKGDAPGICKPDEWAVTNTRLDFIITCPSSFTAEVAQTPLAVDVKDREMTKDDSLDKYGSRSLSRILIHEFNHWFGGSGTGGTANWNDDYRWVSNLARVHQGANAENTGPSKATLTAEAYAIFAMMA
ncbi:hypothetical protein ACHAPA_004356 [Fusarium lateritium]